MKLAYQYDDNFTDLKNYFLSNIQDDFELICSKLEKPHIDSNANFVDKIGGGIDYWIGNTKYLLSILDSCKEDEYFMFSDVDIVFFKPILPTINKLIGDHDALFSREVPFGKVPWQGGDIAGNINFGFIVMRSCDRSKSFLKDLLFTIENQKILNQIVVNRLLYGSSNYNLKWDLLPVEFTNTNFFGPLWPTDLIGSVPTDLNKEHKLVNKNSLTFHAIYPIDPISKMNLLKFAVETVKKDENNNQF